MNQPSPQIYCSNSVCSAPLNAIGKSTCQSCGTPLVYRYLWAVGEGVAEWAPGSHVSSRYYVTAPRIWLDTQPSLPPEVPDHWSDAVTPYLRLYLQRLHVPEVYGFCLGETEAPEREIFLLENIPLDASGILYPSLAGVWEGAHPVRQLYWLWQLLELWQPLQEEGVAASLFAPDNIRVEGWRVRLCQLYQDAVVLPDEASTLTLGDLARLWMGWLEQTHSKHKADLWNLCEAMQQPDASIDAIAPQLNQLLLAEAARLPLKLNVIGLTDTGRERSHNEDSCYPLTTVDTQNDGLFPKVAIVCDGIGGHEGGEVASQLAVRALKLQAHGFLTEIAQQTDLVSPKILADQLEASARVANNLIAEQNNQQGRADRRRMGTTLMMAIQAPQRITTPEGTLENGHELYLVSVGDSRAYWITPRYCQQLTIDDDVSTREVRLGRALYRESLQRPDAGALTQALGTRDGDFLRPHVQRFVLEEDGILMLCSDGLSDNHLVEQNWRNIADLFFLGKRNLTETANAWVDLANQKNGHDNTSVVLLHARVSPPVPEISLINPNERPETVWSEASQVLADTSDAPEPEVAPIAEPAPQPSGRGLLIVGLLTLLLLTLGVGFTVWKELNPNRSQPTPEQPSP